jgi:hypothetical protein
MGNKFGITISKHLCTCVNDEDGYFLDLINGLKKNPLPLTYKYPKDKKANISQSEYTVSEESAKKYETITIEQKGDEQIIKSEYTSKEEKHKHKKDSSMISEKNYLKEFEYSESEKTYMNIDHNTDDIKVNNSINESNNEEKEDINNVNKNTDYYQLAKKLSESIQELKYNIFNKDKDTPKPTPIPTPNLNCDFDNILKKLDKTADDILFKDVIGCIKKISDINSEVTLINNKIYLAIVNKFKKVQSKTHFINYDDIEKVVEIPNFKRIKRESRKVLGKFNNPKFKFHKFTLQGSFPNEILIWKLISLNMEKIKEIINNNYYCCAVLLPKNKTKNDNETIIYFVSKI